MCRKIKSVSFNLNDPFEQEMYEYSLKFANFSSFVKRLIQNSIGGIEVVKPVQKVEKSQMEQVLINPEHLKQLI